MLTLSRKLWSKTYLELPDGRTIVVQVVEIGKSQVKLGFQADKDIRIIREEIMGKDRVHV